MRDRLIQRFEVTPEFGHKVPKRCIKFASANPDQSDQMKFQDLIWTANENGFLLGGWIDWRGFREMSAKNSYTYEEKISLEVVEIIPHFIEEVFYLRNRVQDALHD